MQPYARLWERLLALLATMGEVNASTPGRIRLRTGRRRVEIVMNEDDWSDLAGTIHGSFDGAARHLRRALAEAEAADAPYLVYYTYELEPSQTPESPMRLQEEADVLRQREHLRDHLGSRGEWRAYPPGHESG